jgi:hypothetical protein
MTELVCAFINKEYSRPSLYITQHINTIYIITDSKIRHMSASFMTQALLSPNIWLLLNVSTGTWKSSQPSKPSTAPQNLSKLQQIAVKLAYFLQSSDHQTGLIFITLLFMFKIGLMTLLTIVKPLSYSVTSQVLGQSSSPKDWRCDNVLPGQGMKY